MSGGACRVTFLGHATVLIELDGVRIITDPALSGWIGPIRRVAPSPDPELLEGIDVALVSHAHLDHLDRRSLRRLPDTTRALCPSPAARAIASRGLEPEILRPGDSARVGGLEIVATEASHNGQRWPLIGGGRSIGFVIRGSRSVYFAGDTEVFDGMHELGDIDLALLPVAGWGPRLPAGHMGPDEAAEAAALVAPAAVIPIHWGTLRRVAMRKRERLDGPPRRFLENLERRAPSIRGILLEPGESVEL